MRPHKDVLAKLNVGELDIPAILAEKLRTDDVHTARDWVNSKRKIVVGYFGSWSADDVAKVDDALHVRIYS